MGDLSKDINSKFVNDQIKAIINIKYTANWINSLENEFFRPYGISPQQFNILRILRGANEPIKVQTIKNRMIERAPNATRLMDKLCDKNLIKRVRCDHDRRVVFISITNKGLELLAEIDKCFKLEFFEKLTDQEALVLNELLDKIR